MLVGTHTIADLGGRYAERSLQTTGTKLLVCEAEGITLDETLFRRRHPIRTRTWSGAWCVLAGHAMVQVGAHTAEVGPGSLVVTHDNATPRFRIDARAETWRVLGFTWETPHDARITTSFDDVTVSSAHRSALETLTALEGAPANVLAGVRDVLRANGLPLEDLAAADLAALYGATREDRALFAAALAPLNHLESKPMLADVQAALALSARQTARKLAKLGERFDIGAWRTHLGAWRTMAACALLSRPGATTEWVAKRVGFGSPVALCHAFQRAGLPSPGTLHHRA